MSTTPLPIPEFLPFLEVIQPENFVFCHSCKSAVWFNALENHLCRQHNIGAKVRNPTMTYLKSIGIAATKADIPPRPSHSLPIPFLPLHDGLSCNLCPYVTTTNPKNFRNHLHTAHTIKNPISYQQQNGNLWTSVKLHTWYNLPMQGYQHWIVDISSDTSESNLLPIERSESLSSEEDEDRQDWNLDGDHYQRMEGYERAEISPWIQRMGWAELFDGRPMQPILATTYLPDKVNINDIQLGIWKEMEIVSYGDNENRIRKIVDTLDAVIERALITLRNTPNLTRRWIKSYKLRSPFRSPLKELGKIETLKRYSRIWKRMLTYLFRVYRMKEQEREEIYGLVFRQNELDLMDQIWKTADGSRHTSSLAEYLFLFCIKLLTHEFNNGNPEQSLLINFTSVLGLQPGTRCFKTPRDYTSYLAGMLYLGRLFVLEYALPVYEYTYVNIPGRDNYKSQIDRLHGVHERYLVRGSYNSIGEIIERLAYGKAIAKRMGPKPKLEWSRNKKQLRWENQVLDISDFKSYAKAMINELQEMIQELLPELDLKFDLENITDVMSIPDRDYYFRFHPDNQEQGLDNAYRKYVKYYSMEGSGQMFNGKSWDKGKIKKFTAKSDKFLKLLWLCIHITGGQPGRASETSPCKFKNTDILRNVMFYKGSLLLLFSYNKKANHEFWIARFLPYDVGCLLYAHLIYLRPFTQYLFRKTISTFASKGSYLYASAQTPNKHWNSRVLSQTLKESSSQYFDNIVFGLTTYRQMMVAISDEFIGESNFNLKGTMHNPTATALALQTGHSLRLRQANYGLQKGYPAALQPKLLDTYLDISSRWHRWLGLDLLQHNDDKEMEDSDDDDEEPPRKRMRR